MLDTRRLIVLLGAMLVPGAAFASADLARSKNCVACHHTERRVIGPAFTAIAGRYDNDDANVRILSERIIAGTGGHWGPTPMPPQSSLSQEEAEALVRWILSLR
ncbi:c-type cytochrome [Humitalea sp. 24SJ18S-53]|uniref:c-type cytochrome n=1 Tax=Humitalea sp. 24SJ18S-53 TaxID=3422307 RepID=UPI003D66A7E6